MNITELRKEAPNVAKLIRMLNEPVFASILENVLIGDMLMDWNGGEPLFSLTPKGEQRVKSMMKGA